MRPGFGSFLRKQATTPASKGEAAPLRPADETLHDIRNALATVSANLNLIGRRCADDAALSLRVASAHEALARVKRLLAELPRPPRVD